MFHSSLERDNLFVELLLLLSCNRASKTENIFHCVVFENNTIKTFFRIFRLYGPQKISSLQISKL